MSESLSGDAPLKPVAEVSGIPELTDNVPRKTFASSPGNPTPDDLDGDGMPNDWETANGLNPDDATDAGSDFDRDGLTALQEYQHGTSPIGQWSREIIDTSALPAWVEWLYPVGLNDSGSLIISGGGNDPDSGTLLNGSWLRTSDGEFLAITHPNATRVYANDLNASDEVVGLAYDANNNRLPFFWSPDEGWQDIDTPPNVTGPVRPYRINSWGDVLLYDADWKSVLVDADGYVFDTLEDDWTSPQITDINDFREVIGTYTNPADGLSYTFLKAGDFLFSTNLPSSYPDLASYENFSSSAGMMNNYGEFAGDYSAWGPDASEYGAYFYDGQYQLFEGTDTSYHYAVGVNEAPQLLLYYSSYENDVYYEEHLLRYGNIEVAMEQLVPPETDWEYVYYYGINNLGETYGDSYLQDGTAEVFIDRPDQDQDGDGMSDDWESYYYLDPYDASDAGYDEDLDGVSNLGEYRLRRDPTQEDPQSGQTGQVADTRPGIDTDGDGMPNVWEIQHGLDWENPSDASQDPDRDGYTNLQEFHLGTTPVGDPTYRIQVIGEGYLSNVYHTTLNDSGRVTANGTTLNGHPVALLWDNSSGTPVISLLSDPEVLGARVYCQADDAHVFGGQHQVEGMTQYFPSVWRSFQPADTHHLSGMTQGQMLSLSSDGKYALGKGYINNKWQPLLVDEMNQLHQLPTAGADSLGYGTLGIHEDGHAVGELQYSGYGTDAVIWHKDPGNNTWTAQRLPSKTSPGVQLSRSGELIAAWRGYENNNRYPVRVWTAADGVVEVGTLGGRQSRVNGINNTGAFAGYSQALDSLTGTELNKAFIGRRDAGGNWGLVPLATDPGHQSYATALNDHGETVGTIYDGTVTIPVLWVSTGNRHDLNVRANAVLDGFRIENVSSINNRGEILASAVKDGTYHQVLLEPDADTDNDGIPDRIENQYALNPFDASDAGLDPDGDDLSHLEEFQNKTNPFIADTDADGMPDGWEVLWGLDALDPYNATGDHDRDYVTNLQEYQTGTAPVGIYRMDVLDASPISDYKSAYVRSIAANGDILIQGTTQTNQGVGVLAVKENDTFTYHTMPVLASGKSVYPREVLDSGRIFGTAQDSSNVQHIVSWAPGEASLTQHPIPRDTSYAHLPIYDVSANGEFILGYWKNPDGETAQGLIRLDETGNASVEQFGISASESLPNGYYNRWFNSVTNDGLVIGVDQIENYDDYTTESTVVLLDPVTGVTGIGLPESPYADDPYGSYAYSWLTGELLADGTQLITRETYTDQTHVETLLLETNDLTVTSVPYPLKGYAYPVGIARNGTIAAQDENMYGHLVNDGHSLQIKALRILGSQSSFTTDPATLPRADELQAGGFFSPNFISKTGSIAGKTNTGSPGDETSIWIITEVLDDDNDGIADDWERYRAKQLLESVDPATLTAEQLQQLQTGNLDADTDYDGNGRTAGDDYRAVTTSGTDMDGDGIPDEEDTDMDGDGIPNEGDAVPTDIEINWKRTPEVQYVWIPQVQKTGATAVSRHGHILFPYDYWNDFHYENTEPSEILWDSAISDWVDPPGSGSWAGGGLRLNGEAIVVSAGWDAVSDMNDDGTLVGHSYFSGADDGGPSEIPVYMTWKLRDDPTNGYQQPLYAVPSAKYASGSGLLDYGIAVYYDWTDRDLSAIISDDGAIGGQAYSLLPSTNEFISCFVSDGNLNDHTNTMTKWGNFNNADPLAILDQTTGLIMEERDNANDVVHYRTPAGIESLAGLFPNTASTFRDVDISRTPATVGAPAADGNPAMPARPNGRIWFSINYDGGNKVFLEKRRGGTGADRWHEPKSMAQGAIKLNARGEAITGGNPTTQPPVAPEIWRNGTYTDINELTSKQENTEITRLIDLASNGIILAEATENGATKTGLLVPVDIVPDYNRDGMIDQRDRGKVKETNPYRFWVNDDDDKTVEARESEGTDIPGGGRADSDDDLVDGIRDLVDFFPLHLDLQAVLEVFPSDDYYYILKHENRAINFFEFPAANIDGSDEAHSPHSHLKHVIQATSFKNKELKSTNGWGGRLSSSYLSQAKNGKGVILCEAFLQTEKPLILEIIKETEHGDSNPFPSVAKIELPLKIKGVEAMYRHINIRSASGGAGGRATETAEPGNYPDDMPGLESDKYFILVHGYNVNGEQARGWHAEFFKRMWWSGSKARFIGVSWQGEESQGGAGMTSPLALLIPANLTPNYHANVINAFQTADDLAAVLNAIDGEKSIAAHSLGNMVVSLAIQDHGLDVENYFLIDAAVSTESYDAGESKQDNMTNAAWRDYDERLWASEWHKLPWAGNDERKKLTWRGRLGDVVSRTNVYNFYSSEEEVLNNATPSQSSSIIGAITDDLLYAFAFEGNVLGEHTWALQELMKGKSVTGEILGSTYSGWELNYAPLSWSESDFPPPRAAEIYAEIETAQGIPPFPDSYYTVPVNPATATLLAGNHPQLMMKAFFDPYPNDKTHDELLAEAFPARTFAVGRNPVGSFNSPLENRNFDMVDLKNGWFSTEINEARWRHSDIRDVGYLYIYKAYDKFRELGNLDE